MKLVVMVFFMGLLALAYGDTARLGVQVLDATSFKPIKGVEVKGYFGQNDDPWLMVKGSKPPIIVTVFTDQDGRCKLEGRTTTGSVGIHIEKAPAGYYRSFHGWQGLKSDKKNFFGTWQPDDLVVTATLQRIVKPIPLFAKRIHDSLFDATSSDIFTGHGDKACYDLLKGDWLPPQGTGEVADVEFVRLPRQDLGEIELPNLIRGQMFREVMKVRFLGEGNGLVEVVPDLHQLVRVMMAPETGYRPDYQATLENGKDLQLKGSKDMSKCFCFRIRSKTDASGKLVDGFYGKIYGDIYFHLIAGKWKGGVPAGIGNVMMLYYLNPNSLDRNLEWNGVNLFKENRRNEIHGL